MRNQLIALALGIAGLNGSVSATPVTSDEMAALDEAIRGAMAEVMRTGPKEADWAKGGTDIESIVAARPGGLAGNYLLSIDKDGERSISIISPPAMSDLVPKQWKLLSQIGELMPGAANGSLAIEELDRGYIMIVQGTERRVGGASCVAKLVGAQVYATPKASESEIPIEVAKVIFKASIEAVRDLPVCNRYSQKGDAFGIRYFMDDGRTLPHFNDLDEVITIIPAAPVEKLLGSE